MKKTILTLTALIIVTMYLNAQPCPPGSIQFTTQHQIDKFQINYPGCTCIKGDLVIAGDDINNLQGLSVLTSIWRKLTISGNDSLTSLTGLEGLTSIGEYTGGGLGGLRIYANNALTSLAGLQGVNSISGNLTISHNLVLASLEGLDSIEPGSIDDLRIVGNPQLSNCEIQSICDYLSSPTGEVSIYENDNGCNNPAEVASACGFTMSCLPYGNYFFKSQAEIDSFQSNYPSCTDLEGSVYIDGNDITNLRGLELVSSIKSLSIIRNDILTNLEGLEGLSSVVYLKVVNNDALISLAGLDNIESINSLWIHDNQSLSHCEVESICANLTNPSGFYYIHDNTFGCNSPIEVLDSCEANAVNIDEQFAKDYLILSPNPSTGKVHMRYWISDTHVIPSGAEGRYSKLELYSMQGVKVMTLLDQVQQAGEHEITFDISSLPAGMYLLVMQTGNGKVVEKIMKVGGRR